MEVVITGVTAAIVYLNTLSADFVFDDNRAIIRNEDVRSDTPIWHLFQNDFWGTNMLHSGSHKSFRPITVLTFKLNYFVSGLNPWSYHVTNVACHVLDTVLFTYFIKQAIFTNSCRGKTIINKCLFAGVLFAVHPIHTEAVAGIVGRADVLTTVFTLLALILYKKFCDQTEALNENCESKNKDKSTTNSFKTVKLKTKRKRKQRSIRTSVCEVKQDKFESKNVCESKMSLKNSQKSKKIRQENLSFWKLIFVAFCGALAVFSKELGICALPLCVIYDLFIRHKLGIITSLKVLFGKDEKYRHLRTRSWSLFAINCAILVLRILPFINGDISPNFSPSDNPAASCDDILTRVLTFNYIVSFNAMLLIFPKTLCYEWSSDAIPLITEATDSRNIATLLFYSVISLMTRCLYSILKHRDEKMKLHKTDYVLISAFSNFPKLYVFKFIIKIMTTLTINGTCKSKKPKTNVEDFDEDKNEMLNDKIEDLMKLKKLDYTSEENNYSRLCDDEDVKDENSETVSQSSGYGSEQSVEDDAHKEDHKKGSKMKNENCKKRKNMRQSKLERSKVSPALSLRTQQPSINLESNEGDNSMLFSCILMVLSFLPASNIFFYVGFVVAERILYLPSVGFCIFAAEIIFMAKEKINKRFPTCHVIVILLLAMSIKTYIRNEDWQSETTLYRSAISINSSKIWTNYAFSLKQFGHDEEAEVAFLRALEKKKNMADAHYNLGLLRQERGEYQTALKHYNNAIRYRPTLALAYLNKGTVLSALKQPDDAEQIYKDCIGISDFGLRDPLAHADALDSCLYNLGKLKFDSGKYLEAIDKLEDVLTSGRFPKTYSVYNLLGQSYFNLKNVVGAEDNFQLSLVSKEDHVPTLLAYSKLLEYQNKFSAAEEMLKTALNLSPNHILGVQLYSEFLYQRGESEKALILLKNALEKSPQNNHLIVFAATLCRKMNDLKNSVTFYKLALSNQPRDPRIIASLGGVLHLLKRYKEAKDRYLEALEINPDDEMTRTNLAKLERVTVTDLNL